MEEEFYPFGDFQPLYSPFGASSVMDPYPSSLPMMDEQNSIFPQNGEGDTSSEGSVFLPEQSLELGSSDSPQQRSPSTSDDSSLPFPDDLIVKA